MKKVVSQNCNNDIPNSYALHELKKQMVIVDSLCVINLETGEEDDPCKAMVETGYTDPLDNILSVLGSLRDQYAGRARIHDNFVARSGSFPFDLYTCMKSQTWCVTGKCRNPFEPRMLSNDISYCYKLPFTSANRFKCNRFKCSCQP